MNPTTTIDPAKCIEVEAFQSPRHDGMSNAERAIAVARELSERGCEVLSLRANKSPPRWMDIPPAAVEISEADFRRHYAGFEAEKTSATLRREINGVRVWCAIPEPPFVPKKPEAVTV